MIYKFSMRLVIEIDYQLALRLLCENGLNWPIQIKIESTLIGAKSETPMRELMASGGRALDALLRKNRRLPISLKHGTAEVITTTTRLGLESPNYLLFVDMYCPIKDKHSSTQITINKNFEFSHTTKT